MHNCTIKKQNRPISRRLVEGLQRSTCRSCSPHGLASLETHLPPRSQRRRRTQCRFRRLGTHGNTFVRECNLPLFRAKDVDGAIWPWIEGLILDPENLALALRELQAESQRTNQPLQERLAIVDEQEDIARIEEFANNIAKGLANITSRTSAE
jgi:hypothetical protein